MPLVTLPPELTITIVQHLDDYDLLSMRLVCQHFKSVVDGPDISAWCRSRILSNLGSKSGMQLEASTVELLTDVASVRSTCKWLAAAISSHLAACLPPELCLSETNFHERVETTLARDILETHEFLETFRKFRQRNSSIALSGKSEGVCAEIEIAKKTLGLDSLSTVSRTAFLLADILHETLQHSSGAGGRRTTPAGKLLISDDVFVWLLFNAGLRQINHLMCAVDRASRMTVLKDVLGDEAIIVEQSAYYRQPVARSRLQLRQPEQTQSLISLMRWQGPEDLRVNEPLYQRIFRSLRK